MIFFLSSQGSVEHANRDVEDILARFLKENNTTEWADYLCGVLTVSEEPTGPADEVWQRLETEEDLEAALGGAGMGGDVQSQNEAEVSRVLIVLRQGLFLNFGSFTAPLFL